MTVFKFVITEFIMNDQVNDQGSANAYGKPCNIDKRENLISPKISDSDKEIILEHIYI